MSKIPSICMIPSGYKANKVYSVLPTNGDADLATTRATIATRVNQQGLIEEVATGIPRLDYSDGGCPVQLLEPASTNLITYSEDFNLGGWAISRSSFTSNSVTSPNGSLTMGFLTEDTTATNTHYTRSSVSVSDGVEYTLSVFAKAKERDIICLGDNAANQANTGVWFDLLNGLVLTERIGYVGEIEDFGNGIYRCSVTYTASSSRQYIDIALSLTDGVNNYTGDGTSGLYIWGAQLEEQSYATSYIPTNGSEVTRDPDTASKTGLQNYINSSEGVLYAEISALADGTSDRCISLSDTSQSNIVSININAISQRITARVASNGSNIFIDSNSNIQTDFNKIAIKYRDNDISFWVNGVNVGNNTTLSSPLNLSRLGLDVGDGAFPLYGKVKDLRVYNEALSDAELISLTS